MEKFSEIIEKIKKCRLCANEFEHEPRPVVRGLSSARILIVGQAPGSRVHRTGIPFNDPSGDRLRDWMGVDRETFYDEQLIALLPMAFCFPGSSKNGDLPPPPICAQTWRSQLLASFSAIELTLLVGRYAIDWHLPEYRRHSIAATVENWRNLLPHKLVTPHPSPRNNRWLKNYPWFETQCVPALRKRVRELIQT
ncbi:MAG: uracil-DNA glycosylase family protein [Gammaproteobacteria bacterium]